MTIADATFVLVDTESTGVDEDAELLEIAAVRVTDAGDECDAFATLVRPTRPIPPEASAVHHLVDADVADAPERDEAIAALEAFLPPDATLVAHNAEFDRRMLAGLGTRRWLCTERLAHHLLPDAGNFKNGTLYYTLGGPKIIASLHRAAADLVVTGFVFAKLLERYRAYAEERCGEDRARYEKAEQVETLLAFAELPYRIKTMPFGKHKGVAMDELPRDYVEWALGPRGLVDCGADLRWNLERVARRRGAA